jgi:hypothetical protein
MTPYTAGIPIRVSTVEDTMPLIIGTAMRCISSEPVPWLHRIVYEFAAYGAGSALHLGA